MLRLHPRSLLHLVVLLLAWPAAAQIPTYPGLVSQPNAMLTVYCTPGYEARTAAMATSCTAAMAWLGQLTQLGFTPA